MALHDGAAPDGIVLLVLHLVGHGVGLFIGGDLLKGGHLHRRVAAGVGAVGQEAGTLHVGDLLHRHLGGQLGSDLPGGALAHAVDQQVGLAVHQHRAAHLVLPVVIVGVAAQRRFQSADDEGDVAKGLPHPVGIDDGGPVGAESRTISRGIGVILTAALGHGVMGHHGIQIARRKHHAQTGTSQGGKGRDVPPVGLGQHGHTVALLLQQAGDDGRTKGGVIHIGVAGDDEKIIPVPVPGQHVLLAHG